jgi:hypothetical protein
MFSHCLSLLVALERNGAVAGATTYESIGAALDKPCQEE